MGEATVVIRWLSGGTTQSRRRTGDVPITVQLSLIAVSEDFLALHNAGKVTARNVRIDPARSSLTVVNRVDEPFDLRPGESWTFLIDDLGRWTDEAWQVTVTWEGQDEPVYIPLPVGAL